MLTLLLATQLALAAPPDDCAFVDEQGVVQDPLAAYAFLSQPVAVERLYDAATRREARAVRVWVALEGFVRELGTGLADRATEPHCALLPVDCVPDWHRFDALSRTQPGGIRLRQVLDESFRSEAHERGLENRLAASLVNAVLAGVLVSGALKVPVPEARAAEGLLPREAPALVRFGPLEPGPLPPQVAATFRGGAYVEVKLAEPTAFYRAYGGSAGELGSFWTRIRPAGPLQARVDLAIKSQWGNAANQVAEIRVPAGVTVYEGVAAAQGGLVGGGNQVFIPAVQAEWLVK
jgi:hypothetical protein